MSTNKSKASIWQLESDGDTRKGFRLRNHASQCYLGSTFRTFPDVLADRTNDTILHQLYMSLESACISHPTRLASTFFVVDGMHAVSAFSRPLPDTPTDLTHHDTMVENASTRSMECLNALLVHALSIILGQYRLFKFRSLYAHLQDTPLELLDRDASVPSSGATILIALSSICFLLRVTRIQRMDSHARGVTHFLSHGSHKKLLFNYSAGSLLIVCHYLLVAVSRVSYRQGPGVVVSIAMLTVIELWKDAQLEFRIVRVRLAVSDAKTLL